ncbi:HNH endonuclease signature motif containing protein [Streptomyces sp. BPPL-273]|uniref:HNH endonuclease signature motif containing protein n=1 Tax=Streptomyces parvulus TaxID=146923 RepID=A0ABV5DDU9_9ACTN|nr:MULTISPECIES: HNH endonuclease signature motif containing protein [Streptomyces]MCQ4195197.1 HNH endonuclease [Streptomyces parvulus]WHM32736.1 HNH endonuclease signature motif containing protein [Streptomyces sp. BPPL-273]
MGASAYSRERLEEAARGARTLSEALVWLGVDPRSSTRRYVMGRMKRLGVDVSHFQREGVKWTKEILQEAVSASTNMCEVLRYLGLDVVGGHHTHISRRIKAYGIDISHFRMPTRKGKPWRPRTPEGLLVEQPPAQARRIPSDRIKWAMTTAGVPERCARCGTGSVWRGRPLPLEVDHIDGDWRNNRVENLRLLCPNCHSTTDNYRGRGKGRRDS